MEKNVITLVEEENKYEFVDYIGLPYVISKLLAFAGKEEE